MKSMWLKTVFYYVLFLMSSPVPTAFFGRDSVCKPPCVDSTDLDPVFIISFRSNLSHFGDSATWRIFSMNSSPVESPQKKQRPWLVFFIVCFSRMQLQKG